MERSICYMDKEKNIRTHHFGGYTFKQIVQRLKGMEDVVKIFCVYKEIGCKHCLNGTIDVVDKSGTTKLLKLIKEE